MDLDKNRGNEETPIDNRTELFNEYRMPTQPELGLLVVASRFTHSQSVGTGSTLRYQDYISILAEQRRQLTIDLRDSNQEYLGL